jgi:hypothetical protein
MLIRAPVKRLSVLAGGAVHQCQFHAAQPPCVQDLFLRWRLPNCTSQQVSEVQIRFPKAPPRQLCPRDHQVVLLDLRL